MKKQKFIAIFVITSLIASIFLNFILVDSVNAEATPTITTSVYSSDKSIKVDIKNINLDDTHQYKFGVSSAKATLPSDWYNLVETDGNSAWFVITPKNEDMKNVLITSDNAYIFIKDTITDTEVLSGEKISLKMSLDEALNFTIKESDFMVDDLYGVKTGKYQIVKIEDKNIIKKYLNAKDNNQNTLNAVKDLLTKEIPTGNWEEYDDFMHNYFINHLETKYEGLYYLWFQKEFNTGRIVTGYTLYDTYPTGYKLAESEPSQSGSTNTEEQNKTSNTEKQSENSQMQAQSQGTQTQVSAQTENEQSIVEALQGQESTAQEQTNTYNSNNSNSEKSDTTVATTKIPQTGQGMAIVIATIGTVGIAAFTYNATKKYKGIK